MSNNTNEEVPVTHPSLLTKMKSSASHFFTFLFNRETREVIGRDGLSWARIMAYYFLFYTVLGSFFIAFLAIFVAGLDLHAPRYYSESSVMSTRQKINPGLGFRPQIDPEDFLIAYTQPEERAKLTRSMNIYLDKFYNGRNNTQNELADCDTRNLTELREEFRTKGAHCSYDYKKILSGTSCDPDNMFGYDESGPCVIIKLNRIYGWTPRAYERIDELPLELEAVENERIFKNNIMVTCEGEFSADKDAISHTKLVYFSANSAALNFTHVGLMPLYYYPYYNQPDYKAPLVFVQFKHLPRFQLINVLCRAHAANVDSNDKLNLRGMTKFQLFVGK
jgi:sodium/potassium-transporting ATPase subunit beta